MAGPYYVAYDPTASAGQRLAPEVVAEIQTVAPSTVDNGSITTAKLADQAVVEAKIAPGAVGSTEIASGGVGAVNMGAAAVTTAAIEDAAVTPGKTGTGVVTAVDNTGSALASRIEYLTSAQYATLSPPDPNTWYFTSA
ncbi:MAG: hypothetical protein JOY78_13790 [Pseudonocardia sp.]|nr:hypothetical protein [Pseudonocardia sp.]